MPRRGWGGSAGVFLSVPSWDRCRRRAPRGLTMKSPPSPAIPKGGPLPFLPFSSTGGPGAKPLRQPGNPPYDWTSAGLNPPREVKSLELKNRRVRDITVTAVFVGVLVAACSGDASTEPPPPPVVVPTTVTVSPPLAALAALGETVQLTAMVNDQNGNAMTGVTVTWSSSKASVVLVNATGLVMAVDNGQATIAAAAGTASGTAAMTVEQVPANMSVRPDTLGFFGALGDTATVVATILDANGHEIESASVEWRSTDIAVVTVTDGLVTSVGNGAAEVSATAGVASASAAVTVDECLRYLPNEDGTVLPETVWLTPSIITAADTSALESVSFAGRGTRQFWDEEAWQWVALDSLWLFNVRFGQRDGVTEFQVHPQFDGLPAARAQVEKYALPAGRLPRALVRDLNEVEISVAENRKGWGVVNASRGHGFHVFTHHAEQYLATHIEEIMLHEGGHVSLDHEHLSSTGWKSAQEKDGTFITGFARDHPDSEDLAESIWAYFVARYRPDRVTREHLRAIRCGIPHRLAYFDSLDLEMWPF